ncbi:MAG: CHAT domain-containing protein [Xenococcus sp. (in: cyanobacteria)]
MNLTLVRLIIIGCFPLSLLLGAKINPASANQPQNFPVTLSQSSENLESSNLLQPGKKYYQAGQFSAAVNAWQEALEIYQERREKLNQVQTLNYLATAYQELGQWQAAQNAIANSLELLSDADDLARQTLLLRGQALNNQGQLQFAQGQTENAYVTWQQATNDYETAADETGKLISSLNQVQALQAMGKYRQTKSLLEELVTQLQQQPDTLLKAQGLRSLGIAWQTIGQPLQSKEILEQSLALAQQLDSPANIAAAYFGIGNVAQDLGEYDIAGIYYQEAIELSSDKVSQVQAQINYLGILVKLQRSPADLITAIETNLSQLPVSRTSIYARVNLAETLMRATLAEQTNQDKIDSQDIAFDFNTQKIAQFLATAIQQARQIKDPRAEAYSLNYLGKLYLKKNQLSQAQELTEQALQLAQTINADDIIARAATQLGNIRQEQGDIEGAIVAYEVAFTKLQLLRSDLVSINSELQFTFKETIEPTYRDYVSVLLQNDSQENLQKARQVMEALQLAELDNFFRDACLDTYPVVIDEIDVEAAVIYPIILRDRLEVILALPQQPLRHYSTPLTAEQIDQTLKKFFSSLSPGYPRDLGLKYAEQVYDWLIKPAENDLKESNSQTLVFVPDGFFRNLPMSALYDGQNYLIEKYGVAISPGLQLFPEGIEGKQLSMLAMGITEARQEFSSLPGVAQEIEQITTKLASEILLDQEFTQDSFNLILNEKTFPIVHLATHGQFSSNPESTFLLTWSDRIDLKDFDLIFQKRRLGILEPIELLVMSACQTAVGDNRATLGLAGFALRSGARSTVASLWSVSDQATSDLMQEFYIQLSSGKNSKAEALRQAQLKVLSNKLHQHPYFWSSFILVGNWL